MSQPHSIYNLLAIVAEPETPEKRYDAWRQIEEQFEVARAAIAGLMEIAETAMPDSYFITDSRVNIARNWLDSNPAGRSDSKQVSSP